MPSRVAATSVMPLLVAHATGTPSGQTSEVWASVAACFARKPDAAAALQRLVDRPEDPRRAGAVEDYLEEILDADPSFAGALAAILEEDSAVINPAPTIITDAGAVAFGNLHINAGRDAAGRDLTVESASSDATSRRRWRRRRNNP